MVGDAILRSICYWFFSGAVSQSYTLGYRWLVPQMFA
jgi:hypothetical protein